MQPAIKIAKFQSPLEVEIYLAFPHQFLWQYQQQLLPDWDTPVASVILVLQQSAISWQESQEQVIQEKERLRNRFINWGSQLVTTFKTQGYASDLFDPRSGYPYFGVQGLLSFDDNATINTLLNFPRQNYQNCSLIMHQSWGHNFYPGTIVTSASQDIAKLWSEQQVGYWSKLINFD